jgi:excisionase family DNA binding protein
MKRVVRSGEAIRFQPNVAKRIEFEFPTVTEKTISPNEAAEVLGITGEAVKQWVYHGRLPAVKLHNGYWRIKVSDLSNFIAKRLSPPKHRVLISESDSVTQENALKVISETGHDGLIGNSTLDTILKVRNERPSVVILDLTHANGWNLIRKLERDTARRTLIIVSGKESSEQTEIILNSEASAVLNKPIDLGALKRELLRLTGQSK